MKIVVNKKKNNKIKFMFSGIPDTIQSTLGKPSAQHMMPQFIHQEKYIKKLNQIQDKILNEIVTQLIYRIN